MDESTTLDVAKKSLFEIEGLLAGAVAMLEANDTQNDETGALVLRLLWLAQESLKRFNAVL